MKFIKFISIYILCELCGTLLSAKSKTNYNQNYVSQTKSDWVFQRSPRVGSLFIKVGTEKTLYPGSLNCARNQLTLEEFKQDLSISFPSARSGFTYTVVVYKDNYLAKAIGNIKGEDLYEGQLTGYEVAALTDIESSPVEQIFFVEILEQIADKEVPTSTYDRNEWNTIWSSWRNDIITGSAGKTCFVIVPDNQASPSVADDNDITTLFQQFLARDQAS